LGEWVVVGERRIRGRHRKSLMMAVEASLVHFSIYGNEPSLIHVVVALYYYSFQCKSMKISYVKY
jgi:hypothetical protein